MEEVGIFDDDLLAVEHNSPTKPCEIVVTYADNELTVKVLRLGPDGKYFLEAANEAYKPAVRSRQSDK